MQSSCQLEPLISFYNSTMGEWQFFNLSGNVLALLALHSGPLASSMLKVKVTHVSPSLTKFKGYVMKLGLKCIDKHNGNTEEYCLLFKAKGKIHSPLNCSVSVDSTTLTPSITAPAKTSTLVTSPIASSPVVIVTPTITCTSYTATSTKRPPPTYCDEPDPPLSAGIIAVIVIGGVVSLICAFVVVYRYTYIFRTRGLQARNPDHDFDVISNSGPQIYRIPEEPVYDEVPDIPPDKGSAG
ncbi:uncharacterized protein LOC110068657 isoform X2 [Orbicella faveolata]|nr:uncharacterized protein LOC110068657 isoform X2 [Orbicella faveolata]